MVEFQNMLDLLVDSSVVLASERNGRVLSAVRDYGKSKHRVLSDWHEGVDDRPADGFAVFERKR